MIKLWSLIIDCTHFWSPDRLAFKLDWSELFKVDGEQELQQVVQPERMPKYSHVFTNLRAYTNYSIYISAYTKTTGSDHSKSVTVLTHEDGECQPAFHEYICF